MWLFHCLVVTFKFRKTLGSWPLLCYNSPLEEVEGKGRNVWSNFFFFGLESTWSFREAAQGSCPVREPEDQAEPRSMTEALVLWVRLSQLRIAVFSALKMEKRYLQHCHGTISLKCERVLWTVKYCTGSQKKIYFPIHPLIQSGWSIEWTYII